MADMIQGSATSEFTIRNFNRRRHRASLEDFPPYVQDDWRVTKDLTLNIGARVVLWPRQSTESANRLANLVPSACPPQQNVSRWANGVSSSAGVQMDWDRA